jgi:RimJ/RimL family protein N-acetyltransferase
MEQEAMKYWWRCRSEWSADSWSLELCVFLDRRPVGMQSLRASSFRALRSGRTGSWLGRAWQGQGIGTEMRGAMLHLAFEHLAMGEVTSGAMHDNPASARVSIKAGYEPNGRGLVLRRGEATEQQRFRITRERWASLPDSPVTVHGFEACRPMFGL